MSGFGLDWTGRSYLRYALTENGLSPRFLPGKTENLVVADSDEHTEDGHLTEDLSVRQKMVEKRLKKLRAWSGRLYLRSSGGIKTGNIAGILGVE